MVTGTIFLAFHVDNQGFFSDFTTYEKKEGRRYVWNQLILLFSFFFSKIKSIYTSDDGTNVKLLLYDVRDLGDFAVRDVTQFLWHLRNVHFRSEQ